MKIELINYTQDADALLIFTKMTRLSMTAGLLEEIKGWPQERKRKELDYMLKTIPSSWEFVDYTFQLSGVTRAFCLQALRTRSAEFGPDEFLGKDFQFGSFAGQSQRTVNMEAFEYEVPPRVQADLEALRVYNWSVEACRTGYRVLVERGIPPQDARGLLPHATHTNVTAKYNLRTLHDMAGLRLCSRTQGEYQQAFREMRRLVVEVHPWAEPFLRVYCASVGVCAFPNYKECPIKPGIFDPETGKVWYDNRSNCNCHLHIGSEQDHLDTCQFYRADVTAPLTKSEIQARWERMRFEAIPQEDKRNG